MSESAVDSDSLNISVRVTLLFIIMNLRLQDYITWLPVSNSAGTTGTIMWCCHWLIPLSTSANLNTTFSHQMLVTVPPLVLGGVCLFTTTMSCICRGMKLYCVERVKKKKEEEGKCVLRSGFVIKSFLLCCLFVSISSPVAEVSSLPIFTL